MVAPPSASVSSAAHDSLSLLADRCMAASWWWSCCCFQQRHNHPPELEPCNNRRWRRNLAAPCVDRREDYICASYRIFQLSRTCVPAKVGELFCRHLHFAQCQKGAAIKLRRQYRSPPFLVGVQLAWTLRGGATEHVGVSQNRIIVGYSVGYKSLPGRAALLSNAKALAPGVYDPDINDAQLAPDLPPGVQPRRRRQGSPAAAPATGSGQPAGLRRRLAAFSESLGFRGRDQARRLLQVPFQHGAWGNVSYGIRIAYLDASAAFQTLQSAAAGSQSSPPNAVAG